MAMTAIREADGPLVFRTREDYEKFASKLSDKRIHRFGDFWVNTATKTCSDAHLSPLEFCVLQVLIEALPDPVPYAEIGRRVSRLYHHPGCRWDRDGIKVYVYRVRQKLGEWRIRTVGGGYLFVPFREDQP